MDYRCEERLFIASNREQVGAQLWCDGAAAGRHREQPYAAADAPKGGAEVAGPWGLGFLWVTQGGPIPPRHIVGDGGDQSIWRIFWSRVYELPAAYNAYKTDAVPSWRRVKGAES